MSIVLSLSRVLGAQVGKERAEGIEIILKVGGEQRIGLRRDEEVDAAVAGDLHAHAAHALGAHAVEPRRVKVLEAETLDAVHVVHAVDEHRVPARVCLRVLGHEHAVEQRAVDEDHVADVDAAHEHVQRHRATRVRPEHVLHDVLDVCRAVEAAEQRGAAPGREHKVAVQCEDLLLLAKRRLGAVEDVRRHLCAQGVRGVLHLATDVAPALLMLRLTATNPRGLHVDARHLLLAIAFDGTAHGHGAVEERKWPGVRGVVLTDATAEFITREQCDCDVDHLRRCDSVCFEKFDELGEIWEVRQIRHFIMLTMQCGVVPVCMARRTPMHAVRSRLAPRPVAHPVALHPRRHANQRKPFFFSGQTLRFENTKLD